MSPLITYNITKRLWAGTGVNLNFLLFSNTKFHDYENDIKLKNTFYQTFTIGIPVFVGFSYKNFFVRIKFDKGMMNMIKNSDSFFREIENTFSINFGYFIFSKESVSSE